MLNRATAGLAMVIATMEPAMPAQAGDLDILKYAITQGGLLAVVLILLWSRYRDDQRIAAENLRTSQDKDNRIEVMTSLVTLATTAQTRSADSLDRMARAIEQMNGRQPS